MNAEIDGVIGNLDADLKVSAAQIESLQKELSNIDDRIEKVALLRAEYANQLSDVRQKTETLTKAQKDLADVRASQAAALSASVITRLDQPDPGNGPVGPSFPVIVAAGLGGGLMLGLGLVFLVAPIGNLWGRRWSDHAGAGRRAVDQKPTTTGTNSGNSMGRRGSDPPSERERRGEQSGRRISDVIASGAKPVGAAQAPARTPSSQQAKATPPREPAKPTVVGKPPELPKVSPASTSPKSAPVGAKPAPAPPKLKP